MEIKSQSYISPNPIQGSFDNVIITEKSFRLVKFEFVEIEFEMRTEDGIPLCPTQKLGFFGMNDNPSNSNRTTTFYFNSDPTNIIGLLAYINAEGEYPTDYTMKDWGFPSYEDSGMYFTGGTINDPEIQPVNQFVKDWLLNTLVFNGELVKEQFIFD